MFRKIKDILIRTAGMIYLGMLIFARAGFCLALTIMFDSGFVQQES